MNIVIRTDASVHIGSGHVMRCLVLAYLLEEHGYHVSFASRPQQGDLISFVRDKGFSVYELIASKAPIVPENTADYKAWLQVPWQVDAQSLIDEVTSADLIIVDHYSLGEEWESLVKSHYDCKIVAIDDLVRSHNADVIVDQTLLRDRSDYTSFNPNCMVLAGCDYALINPLFIKYRKQVVFQEKIVAQPVNVLITMGGVDNPNATLRVLDALSIYGKQSKIQATVLLNAAAPHYREVQEFSKRNKSWIKHFDFIEDMAELLCRQDVAIGAPGGSSWERACLGLPSIVIPLAENQNHICNALVCVGAALKVELPEIKDLLLPVFDEMINSWASLREVNLSLCDANGALRVTHCISTLLNNNANEVMLRRADERDISQVYKWQCMDETRKYALNPDVPLWEEHQEWMKAKLQATQNYFYIINVGNQFTSVGVLRLDELSKGEFLISIFIDPAYFGRGIARKALAYIDLIHPDIFIKAVVLPENTASQKLFNSAGYFQNTSNTFIRMPLN